MSQSADWRREVEDAIKEGDEIHLRIVLDRVFSEIEDLEHQTDGDWEE
jgi:U3 small nucleolar RNA-associated protein 14